MALDDLGGLGEKEGPPVVYDWTRASLMPLLLPWLMLLLLLGLKYNRQAQAWLVWIPVLVLVGADFAFLQVELAGDFNGLDAFSEFATALTFGLGAVWLLSPSLSGKYRFLNFSGIFLAMAFGSVFAFVVRQDWHMESLPTNIMSLVSLCFVVGAVSVALSVAGLASRRRYCAGRFLGWLSGLVLGLWVLAMTPAMLFALISSRGAFPWLQIGVAVLIVTGVTLGILLPFLILSFSNAFFRERFKALFIMGGGPASGVVPPPLPAGASTPPPENRR